MKKFKILTIISISIILIISFFLYNKSNGVYKTTMRVDEIQNRNTYVPQSSSVDWTEEELLELRGNIGSHFSASKIDGELEVFGGGLSGNKYYEDLFLSKVKEGDTIDVIVDENNKTTKVYYKNILVLKSEMPIDWENR